MEPRVYYIKGAWVLRMLEQVIGQDDMRELLGAARAQHPFAPIDTATFTALAEDISGQELDWFFEQWLSGTGVMELEAKVGSSDEGIELEISQQGAWSEGRYYRMPLEVRLHQGKQERIETIEIEGQTTTFNLDPL
jgi:aminopeptidase N